MLCELFETANIAGCLHLYKERQDRTDRDRQPRESFQEERIRECHQIDELRERRFAGGEAHAYYEPQIRNYEKHRDSRANNKSEMNRDVINEIRQQQVEREESRGEKEIIHRMQLDA